MALTDSATITTQGAFLQMDGTLVGGPTSFPSLDAGSAPDIDITTLRSRGREFRTGFPDPGSVSIPMILAPHSAVEKSLRDARSNGTQHQFTFRFGGALDPRTGYVTNPALEVSADLGDYDVSGRNLTTSADADTLPAAIEGDYLEVGGTDHLVTAVAVGTSGAAEDKAIFTLGGTTAIDDYVANTTVAKLLRPGIKIVFTASVQTFSVDASIDEVLRGTLTLRLSGRGAYSIGSPDLS